MVVRQKDVNMMSANISDGRSERDKKARAFFHILSIAMALSHFISPFFGIDTNVPVREYDKGLVFNCFLIIIVQCPRCCWAGLLH